jgi:hypothetical protein
VKNDGSYCDPVERTEDCYIGKGPGTGIGVKINDPEDLEGICDAKCDKLNGVTVRNTRGLRDLRAFEGITITGGARINENEHLRTTAGIEMDEGASLFARDNPELREVVGLGEVKTLGGLILEDLPQLTSVETLKSVERLKTQGTSNAKFHIKNVPIESLEPIDGMELDKWSYFWVRETEVDELPDLEGQAIYMQIERNSSLDDVSGLGGLEKIWGSLSITGNQNLKNCLATRVRDEIEFSEDANVRIRGNESGSCSE